MTEEITYFYKKGVGWVPTAYEQVSAVIGEYVVTLFDKPPERKEYFQTMGFDEDLPALMEQLKTLEYRFTSGRPSWYFTKWTLQHERDQKRGHYDHYKLVTLKIEKIKPPKKERVRRGRQQTREA